MVTQAGKAWWSRIHSDSPRRWHTVEYVRRLGVRIPSGALSTTFSVFHVDRFLDGVLTMKSMEHGHIINASPELVDAVREVGLLADS